VKAAVYDLEDRVYYCGIRNHRFTIRVKRLQPERDSSSSGSWNLTLPARTSIGNMQISEITV